MKLAVVFYHTASGRSPVEEFIAELSKNDQARFADVYQGFKEHGLLCPRVFFRQLRGKLWEIKFSARGGSYRVAYVMHGNTMIWLHAFSKKTQKTTQRDFEIAEQRMKEVINYET